MTIAELNTPLERRRMIEYGADGCKVVRHWHNVRNALGNVWLTEPETDEYGRTEVIVFIAFPGMDGMKLGSIGGLDWRTVEDISGFDYAAPEDMCIWLDERAEQGKFIGNAQIEFVRQFDEQRANRYAEARAAYYERKEAEEQTRREQRQREEAEKQAERERIDAEARALYCGFADGMTAMQFGRIDSVLSKRVRENNVIMTKREWIEGKIKEGYRAEQKDGVTTWYGSRWNAKESKPKTEYRLRKDGASEYYRIIKTEYDYALHLAKIA